MANMESDDCIRQITDLIAEKLFVIVESPQSDLLETGIVDSAAFVELVLGIEERFGFQIDLEEVEMEDLRSVAAIAKLVNSRRSAVAAGAATHAV